MPSKLLNIRFRAWVTADGRPALYVPCSAISCRLRHQGQSYLQVTVPTYEYAEALEDYNTQGNFRLWLSKSVNGAKYQLVEYVDVDSLPGYVGPSSQSMQIAGHRYTTNASPQTRVLSDALYYKYDILGSTTIRCTLDQEMRPGDTITYSSLSFVSDLVTMSVSIGSFSLTYNYEVSN